MKKILVTGAYGLLGTVLSKGLEVSNNYEVIRAGTKTNAQEMADLTKHEDVCRLLKKVSPHMVINLSALTDVDLCEKHPEKAYLLNIKIVHNIVRVLQHQKSDAHLIQISTDQVYGGTGEQKEENILPVNYYAFSKYAGELVAMQSNATVIRTNFFGKSRCQNRKSFSDWIFDALKQNKRINIFNDIYFSPLSMNTLVKMLGSAIENPQSGIFNLGCRKGGSKADFALNFAREIGFSGYNLMEKRSDMVSLYARRPKDMRMNVSLFEKTFNVVLPTLIDEIKIIKKDYQE